MTGAVLPPRPCSPGQRNRITPKAGCAAATQRLEWPEVVRDTATRIQTVSPGSSQHAVHDEQRARRDRARTPRGRPEFRRHLDFGQARRRRIIAPVATILLGLVLVVVGGIAAQWLLIAGVMLSATGFLVTVGGFWWLFRGGHHRASAGGPFPIWRSWTADPDRRCGHVEELRVRPSRWRPMIMTERSCARAEINGR